MNIFKSLFGPRSGQDVKEERVQYRGYMIQPCPQSRGQGWTTEAIITLETEEETLTHHLIRADSPADRNGAVQLSLSKAQRLIDEAGERIFSR